MVCTAYRRIGLNGGSLSAYQTSYQNVVYVDEPFETYQLSLTIYQRRCIGPGNELASIVTACKFDSYIRELKLCIHASCYSERLLFNSLHYIDQVCENKGDIIDLANEWHQIAGAIEQELRVERRQASVSNDIYTPSADTNTANTYTRSSSITSTTSTIPASVFATPTLTSSGVTSETSSPGGGGGLSSGAKVGIGLGVPLGVIIIAACAWAGWYFGNKNRKRKSSQISHPPPGMEQKYKYQQPLPQQGPHELPDSQFRGSELVTGVNFPELPSPPRPTQSHWRAP
ncbi:hypothetical protein M501DRAFT_991857 [Patellaria atrata CBS 101060]|uniref:Uncharacterized protein n=1 Tax=Patellaria atrata CBS 101060 TaxID=1346257 RepID=A0A9P4SCB9_9PEZI|nr:hypothetical protein M501DRAFT_991857 [Patellaria atrata CBS 101060]